MVGMLKTTVRRMLKQANLGREWWSYACRFAGHVMREKVLGREWPHLLFGQLVGIWKSHDKAQAKSLDDRGCVGYLLDIDIWQSGTTRIMQDGVVIKGLAARRLDPARYHLNPNTDLNELEKGMPWRTIQDEFGKFKWIDHAGRIYHGTPFSVEPDVTSKHIFIASMIHNSIRSPVLKDKPDVTCPSDFPDGEKRKEVVHHEQIPDCDVSKSKKNAPDEKSNVVIKAKSIPATPKAVASSQGAMRQRWLVSIYIYIKRLRTSCRTWQLKMQIHL